MSGRDTELLEQSLGNYGSKEITGTSAVTPAAEKQFTAIIFLEDSVVTAQTDADGYDNADLTAFSVIPTGYPVYCKLTSITLSSGSAIAYYG